MIVPTPGPFEARKAVEGQVMRCDFNGETSQIGAIGDCKTNPQGIFTEQVSVQPNIGTIDTDFSMGIRLRMQASGCIDPDTGAATQGHITTVNTACFGIPAANLTDARFCTLNTRFFGLASAYTFLSAGVESGLTDGSISAFAKLQFQLAVLESGNDRAIAARNIDLVEVRSSAPDTTGFRRSAMIGLRDGEPLHFVPSGEEDVVVQVIAVAMCDARGPFSRAAISGSETDIFDDSPTDDLAVGATFSVSKTVSVRPRSFGSKPKIETLIADLRSFRS